MSNIVSNSKYLLGIDLGTPEAKEYNIKVDFYNLLVCLINEDVRTRPEPGNAYIY